MDAAFKGCPQSREIRFCKTCKSALARRIERGKLLMIVHTVALCDLILTYTNKAKITNYSCRYCHQRRA